MSVSSGASEFEASVPVYLSAIREFALLSSEEEKTLTVAYTKTHDQDISEKLITSHLRLVTKIAMQHRHYGLPMADLIAEGNIGLLRAVEKFDPDCGCRLSTYAMWWIKASIKEYVLANWSLVKITAASAHKRLFYNLRKLKAQLGAYGDAELSDERAAQIAKTLGVDKADVLAMDARLSGRDASLNTPIGENGGGERQNFLVDDSQSQEEYLAARQERERSRRLVRQAMNALNDREKQIITQRRLLEEPITLEHLGQQFGVSRERVRQIELRAMKKLEGSVRALIAAEGAKMRQAIAAWKSAFIPAVAAS